MDIRRVVSPFTVDAMLGTPLLEGVYMSNIARDIFVFSLHGRHYCV